MRTTNNDLNWARQLTTATLPDIARLRLLARQSSLPAHRATFERVLSSLQIERPTSLPEARRKPITPPLSTSLIERRFAAAIRRSRPNIGREEAECRAQLVAKRVTARRVT